MKLPCELKIYDKKLNLYIPNNYEYIKSIHFNTLGQIDFIITEFVNVTSGGKPFMQECKYCVDEIDIYVNGKRFFNDMQNSPTPEERPGGRTAGRG